MFYLVEMTGDDFPVMLVDDYDVPMKFNSYDEAEQYGMDYCSWEFRVVDFES